MSSLCRSGMTGPHGGAGVGGASSIASSNSLLALHFRVRLDETNHPHGSVGGGAGGGGAGSVMGGVSRTISNDDVACSETVDACVA